MGQDLDSDFLREFSASFDADVIQIKDRQSLEGDAIAIVGNLVRAKIDTAKLKLQLEEFLKTWDQDTINQLKQATFVDWQFNKETEAELRFIIEMIIKEIDR